jgi:hypothetical protein
MKSVLKLIALVFAFIMPMHTAVAQKEGSSKRMEIERLFMHQVGVFSVVIMTPQGEFSFEEIKQIWGVHVVPDVPQEKKMYVEYISFHEGSWGMDGRYSKIVIHIHSVEDINGGGYEVRYGKSHQQVQTTVVK